MRNFIGVIVLALFAAAPAMAQGTTPKTEFFFGYEYEHLNPTGRSCNGFDTNLAYNLNDWLGAVGDFGYCHESGAHDVNYLFGPRATYRTFGKWNPFAQVLFGGHHLGVSSGGSANSFAMTLGGGIDYKYNDHFYVRAIQIEYLNTHLGNSSQNNARITAGLVYTF